MHGSILARHAGYRRAEEDGDDEWHPSFSSTSLDFEALLGSGESRVSTG
jgi:hypothetical protein